MYNNLINCFGGGVGSNQGGQIFFYVLNHYRAFHNMDVCISVSTHSLFSHVFTIQCARMYVYVHVHNVLFVHVTKIARTYAFMHADLGQRGARNTHYANCFFRWLPRSKCCSSKTWFMCTLCACYFVDCLNGTRDNTAAVILLYRQVTGSAPSNAPLSTNHLYLS